MRQHSRLKKSIRNPLIWFRIIAQNWNKIVEKQVFNVSSSLILCYWTRWSLCSEQPKTYFMFWNLYFVRTKWSIAIVCANVAESDATMCGLRQHRHQLSTRLILNGSCLSLPCTHCTHFSPPGLGSSDSRAVNLLKLNSKVVKWRNFLQHGVWIWYSNKLIPIVVLYHLRAAKLWNYSLLMHDSQNCQIQNSINIIPWRGIFVRQQENMYY